MPINMPDKKASLYARHVDFAPSVRLQAALEPRAELVFCIATGTSRGATSKEAVRGIGCDIIKIKRSKGTSLNYVHPGGVNKKEIPVDLDDPRTPREILELVTASGLVDANFQEIAQIHRPGEFSNEVQECLEKYGVERLVSFEVNHQYRRSIAGINCISPWCILRDQLKKARIATGIDAGPIRSRGVMIQRMLAVDVDGRCMPFSAGDGARTMETLSQAAEDLGGIGFHHDSARPVTFASSGGRIGVIYDLVKYTGTLGCMFDD